MIVEVTLQGFSCRPDPTWILNKEQIQRLNDLVMSTKQAVVDRSLGAIGNLGYSGFLIRVYPSTEGEEVPVQYSRLMRLYSDTLDLGNGGPSLKNLKFLELQKEWLSFVREAAAELRNEKTASSFFKHIGEDQLFIRKRLGREEIRISNTFIDNLITDAEKDIQIEAEFLASNEGQQKTLLAPKFLDLKSLVNFGSPYVANPYDKGRPDFIRTYAPFWNDDVYFSRSNWKKIVGGNRYNNCYNYATTKINNAFAQPGRSHGINSVEHSRLGFINGAELDGLKKLSEDVANVPNLPDKSHLLALFTNKSEDSQHWLRMDIDNTWSHKWGIRAPSQSDENGDPILGLQSTMELGRTMDFVAYFECEREKAIVL